MKDTWTEILNIQFIKWKKQWILFACAGCEWGYNKNAYKKTETESLMLNFSLSSDELHINCQRNSATQSQV
jgi:hypothetical protein